ncbi:MAG TPA: hypothetical protein VMC80_03305 [Patescibacteria group bacterium]|nr:hypothetical protein [Patescibacteria group bacterium]
MAKRKGARKKSYSSHVPRPSRASKSKSHKLYREPLDYNKTLFTASIVALFAVVYLLLIINNAQGFTGADTTNLPNQAPGSASTGTITTGTIGQGSWFNIVGNGIIANVMQYIFGTPISNEMTGLIITIAVWLMLLFSFGDIIATFSTFSPWVSWVIAVLITLVGANIGLVNRTVVVLTGIFVGLGALAVYFGLGVAFFAFIVVNLGAKKFQGWILRRKAMTIASKVKAGGKTTAASISALQEVRRAFEAGSP